MGALVSLFQAQLEEVLVGVLVLQQKLVNLLAMTFLPGCNFLQSVLDVTANMRSEKAS